MLNPKLSKFFALLSLSFFLFSCETTDENVNSQENYIYEDNVGLTLGNPSNAVSDIRDETNFLLLKNGYTASFNNKTHISNWVAWHLDTSDLGDVGRSDSFVPDSALPSNWYQVKHADYTNSGFDRGHLCPSADRTATAESNAETFLMSNIVPQSPNNNRIVWEGLEEYERTLAKSGNELYIYAGGLGKGGTGSKGYLDYIPLSKTDDNGILVPSSTWKIIVVLPVGENDVSRISKDTKIIAVNIPNIQDYSSIDSVSKLNKWKSYLVSVDFLEESLGFDFLDNVPTDIQKVIESKIWSE